MKMIRLTGLATAAVLAASAYMAVPATANAAELVSFSIVGDGIPKSLTGKPGDPAKGRKIAYNRKQGNCLACHKMPIPEQQFHGEIAPGLEGVADRISEAEMRLRIVNPKVINPDTFMPAFYRNTGFTRVLKKFKGKTILSAEQVEDLVAYMMTLK
jgi:sulfur-oxidizing protein SoxX